jgi:hypothetical protein
MRNQFFLACSDLKGLLAQRAPGDSITLEYEAWWGAGGGTERHRHHDCGMRCYVVGQPAEADKVLRALKAEAEKMARRSAAEILDTAERKGADARLIGFEIKYAHGNAHGKIKATVGRTGVPVSPKRPERKGDELVITIEESVLTLAKARAGHGIACGTRP